MSAFADIVMRSSTTDLPTESAQLWSNSETTAHLKKFVDIHTALAGYKQSLINEAQFLGPPIVRPLMLHFSSDLIARTVDDQFMLGENIMVAPVFGGETRDVYLPGPAKWKELWTGTTHILLSVSDGLTLHDVSCPIGYPPVYYRDTDNIMISYVLKQFREFYDSDL